MTDQWVLLKKARQKFGKASESSEGKVVVVIANGEIRIEVVIGPCQRVLDGKEMPDEQKTNVIVSVFNG